MDKKQLPLSPGDYRGRLTAAEVLQRYKDEDLPAFCGIALTDVNQVGVFGERPLDVAAVRGNPEEIVALLEGGAEVNAAGEHGHTALHEAVSQGNLAAVKLLVEFGALVDVRNEFGQTALDIACSRNRQDLVALLKGGA
jgi:ankyrin repeat protein